MSLNGNHLDSRLTAGTRSAIISFVFICCSIICRNGCCQKQPHAGPQWHTEPKTEECTLCRRARLARLTFTLRPPPPTPAASHTRTAAGGKTLYSKQHERNSIACRNECGSVFLRVGCVSVWLVSACRWRSCLDVSMKSDPDWTSSAQEPLPELINHFL